MPGVTEDLDFLFYLILTNLTLSSHMWQVDVILESILLTVCVVF